VSKEHEKKTLVWNTRGKSPQKRTSQVRQRKAEADVTDGGSNGRRVKNFRELGDRKARSPDK